MSEPSPALRPDDVTSLRRAAAMAHIVAGLEITLRHGPRVLAAVVPTADRTIVPDRTERDRIEPQAIEPQAIEPHAIDSGPGEPSPIMSGSIVPRPIMLDPCGFRNAVARAWADQQAGQRVSLVGQESSGLDVEWTLRRPGALLGFGAVRTRWAGRTVWALASVLASDALGGVFDDLAAESLSESSSARLLADGIEARIVEDRLLGVSIIYVEAEQVSRPLVAGIDEAIRRFVAVTATAELLTSLHTV